MLGLYKLVILDEMDYRYVSDLKQAIYNTIFNNNDSYSGNDAEQIQLYILFLLFRAAAVFNKLVTIARLDWLYRWSSDSYRGKTLWSELELWQR